MKHLTQYLLICTFAMVVVLGTDSVLETVCIGIVSMVSFYAGRSQ